MVKIVEVSQVKLQDRVLLAVLGVVVSLLPLALSLDLKLAQKKSRPYTSPAHSCFTTAVRIPDGRNCYKRSHAL